jgi:hypothetical protein
VDVPSHEHGELGVELQAGEEVVWGVAFAPRRWGHHRSVGLEDADAGGRPRRLCEIPEAHRAVVRARHQARLPAHRPLSAAAAVAAEGRDVPRARGGGGVRAQLPLGVQEPPHAATTGVGQRPREELGAPATMVGRDRVRTTHIPRHTRRATASGVQRP